MKKICAILLVMCVVVSIATVPVYATQSKVENFNKNYSLSGKPANDIASVAEAQEGRTGASYGYTEHWCADFVSDCARSAGISTSVIPYTGGVPNMYNAMLSNGAYTVSSPQRGDLVFYWDGSSWCHVAVMIDSVYSIHGNVNGQSGNFINTSYVTKCKYSSYNNGSAVFVRPNYGNVAEPFNLWISLPDGEESSYKVNEEFVISFGASNANKYTFIIYNGKTKYYEETFYSTTGTVSINALFEKIGHYSGYIVAENASGKIVTSSWIGWDIVDKAPTNLEISVDRGDNAVYCVGENVMFSLIADSGWYKHIGIHREDGTLYKEGAVSGTSYVTTIDEAGKFYADFDSMNTCGTTRSDKVYFEVTDSPPEYAKLSIKGTYLQEYPLGQTIRFVFSTSMVTNKYIGVHKNGVFYYGAYVTEDFCDLTFNEPGEYCVDFDAINKFGTTRSNKIYINISDQTHIHMSSSWITDKTATVYGAGSKHKECTECGEILETATIAQLKCSAPKLSKVQNTASGVKVTWSKVSGADKYRVYRKVKGGSWAKVADTTSTSYTDKTAKSGTTYYYTVKAFNEAGGGSYNKTGLAIRCVATPKLKKIENATTSVKITWSKVAGADGYYVYRKASGATSWTRIANVKKGSTTSYKDTKVSSGKNYTYTVKAYDGGTKSSHDSKGLTIKFLATPKLLYVTTGKSGITVKWDKVTGASGYIVYRKTGSGSWVKIATVKGNSKVSYLDKTAKKGKTYTYTVKAYNGDYKSYHNTKGLKIKDKY